MSTKDWIGHPITVGDVVRVKGSDVPMTVEDVSLVRDSARCVWFEQDENGDWSDLKTGEFPIGTLVCETEEEKVAREKRQREAGQKVIHVCARCRNPECISKSKDVPCARFSMEAKPETPPPEGELTELQALREAFLRLCQQYQEMGKQLAFLSEVVTVILERKGGEKSGT